MQKKKQQGNINHENKSSRMAILIKRNKTIYLKKNRGKKIMGTVAFEKVEQSVKVIGELVEQGECFFRNDKYQEIIAEIRTLESFVTEKYLEDAEETNAEVTAVEIEKQLHNLIAASHNKAAKKIYKNTLRVLKG